MSQDMHASALCKEDEDLQRVVDSWMTATQHLEGLSNELVRPPLKIIWFPVHRPGDLISTGRAHFFHISRFFLLFFPSIFPTISIQRKKR